MSEGKQRTPRAKAETPDLANAPLHPNVDAVLWILARATARIALERAEAEAQAEAEARHIPGKAS
jgi:hypothetical protein